MGIGPGSRCKSSPYVNDYPASGPLAPIAPNPNPSMFEIEREFYLNGYLILQVKYTGCTNFEGRKIMVYEGFASSKELLKHNLFKLDPHFADRKGSPIARFKPCEESKELIRRMIGSI